MKRYTIVGFGAAGFAAAETIRNLDGDCEITILGAEAEGFYSRPALAYYLSNEIDKKSLFPFTKIDFRKLNLNIQTGYAISINPEAKLVILQSGAQVPYDKLLLATGAAAVQSEIEGSASDGVFYLDSYAQTQAMIKKARRGKKAFVIGGGITALEIVEGLHARKMEVHFLLRGDVYWNRVLDPLESRIILDRLQGMGIHIHKNTELVEILGKNGILSHVRTNQGELFRTDLVGAAIGVKPRIDLAKKAGLDVNRGIKVNNLMETSRKDIFAAGDGAEIYDPEVNAWIVDSLWPIARQQGIIAGQNMAGPAHPYQRRVPMNVTRLAGLTTTIIGTVGKSGPDDDFEIVRGESEAWQIMPDAVVCQNSFEVNRLRLQVGKTTILGAVLIGDQSLSRTLADLVTKQIPIEPIREELLSPEANLSSILLKFNQERTISHAD